jgi:iron-sulfur cluster assembly protein
MNDLFLTERATNQLKKLRANETDILKLSVVGGGCSGLSYKLDWTDTINEKDQVYKFDDITVICDIKSFLYVCSMTIDYSDGLDGKGFEFKNPNANRTCGCGESFSL